MPMFRPRNSSFLSNAPTQVHLLSARRVREKRGVPRGVHVSSAGGRLHAPAAARSNSYTDISHLVRRRLVW